MITTSYAPSSKRTSYESSVSAISRVKYLDVAMGYKVMVLLFMFGLQVGAAAISDSLLGNVSTPVEAASLGVRSLIAFLMYYAAYKFMFVGGFPVEKAYASIRGISDETRDIVQTYRTLVDLRPLTPESTAVRERIDEYGRLAFTFLQECSRLPKGMEGRHKEYYRLQNEIQTQAKKLIDAGNELVDLVTSRRAENTLDTLRHIGLEEYAEHISIETMAHRALTTGSDEPKKAPIKPRPGPGARAAMRESFERVKNDPYLRAKYIKEGDPPDIQIMGRE